jgi:iron(III) transport system substrate-binding protein
MRTVLDRRSLLRVSAIAAGGTLAMAGLAACGGSNGTVAATATDGSGNVDLAAIESAARSEGAVSWYTASPQTFDAAIIKGFQAKYPQIKVNLFYALGGPMWQKFMTEEASGKHSADVISQNNLAQVQQGVQHKFLASYLPQANKGKLAANYFDPAGHWWSMRLGVPAIVYNTASVPAQNAPTTWTDLLDPYWTKDNFGIGDPAQTDGAYDAYYEMSGTAGIGDQYFVQLLKKKPPLYASAGQITNALTAGEIKATITLDYTAWQAIDKGAALKVVYPTVGSPLSRDYNMISAHAPHPNAARLFQEYYAGPEAADILAKVNFEYSTIPTVYPDNRPALSALTLLTADFSKMDGDHTAFNKKFDGWYGRSSG